MYKRQDNDTVIMQGPLELKQGGYGIAVRNPVYLEDENGQKSFWGFTIVILDVYKRQGIFHTVCGKRIYLQLTVVCGGHGDGTILVQSV